MVKRSIAFSTFLLILFVLVISGIGHVRGELCEHASKTWSGNCGNTGKCDSQCQSWEKAAHGAFHVHGGKHMCCYFNCPLSEKLAQDKARAQEIAQEKVKAKKFTQVKINAQVEHP